MTEWCRIVFKETDEGIEMLVEDKCLNWLKDKD